ncbi:MAG: phosphodiesterase [Syntrophorhabdales bacterium]|jgi:hypothetical protein
MKIGLISDTHGSVKGFQKAVEGCFRDVEMILHAGDVLYHGPRNPLGEGYNTSALAERINGLEIPIMIARGNCDADVDQLVLDPPLLSPYVFLNVDGKRLLVIHGENKRDGDFKRLVGQFGLAVLVHGHSHIARIKKVGGSLIVNPGTPTIPNPSSSFGKTAAVLDSKAGAVKIFDVETGAVVLEGIFDV